MAALKIIKIDKPNDNLYIYWTLTDLCNFKCNYCLPNLHSGKYAKGIKDGYPTDIEITTFIDRLINVHLKGRKLFLTLSGGEPTLHPMYEMLIETLNSYGSISTTTNGSRGLTWWKNLRSFPDYITISLHPEFTNIQKINDLCLWFEETNRKFNFNFMCDPNNWHSTVDLYMKLDDRLKKYVQPKVLSYLGIQEENNFNNTSYEYDESQNNLIKALQGIFNLRQAEALHQDLELDQTQPTTRKQFIDSSFVTYSDESVEPIHGNMSKIIINKQNQFLNLKCAAGSSGISISYSGMVYGGICRSVELGRLDTFELLDDYLTCPKNFCACTGDLRLPKYDTKYK